MSVENSVYALPALPLALPLKPLVDGHFWTQKHAGNVATLAYSCQKTEVPKKKSIGIRAREKRDSVAGWTIGGIHGHAGYGQLHRPE